MARERLTAALAALFPPLVVLASVHELYLRNQQDLDRTLSVLYPFWACGAAVAVAAALLQRASGSALARQALAALYTGGVAFVAWSFLRAWEAASHAARYVLDTWTGTLLFAAAVAVGAVAAARGAGARRLEPPLAALAALLLAREAIVLSTRLDRAPPPTPRDFAAEFGTAGEASLPNVYHILLDALQDELVSPCWPPGDGDPLEGFVSFRVRAPLRSTLAVLPLVFSGRFLPEGKGVERVREALQGEPAFVRDLARAGYRTLAFVPSFAYGPNASAFDLTVLHDQNAREPDLAGLHAAVFKRLWLYSTLPSSVAWALARGSFFGFGEDFFRMADVERISSHASPIVARLSMESLIELEPRLPARGRYTLVHLLLPHNPYVLRADCSHDGATSYPAATDLRQQTQCALLLVRRYLETLRRLDRLAGSVVVVHGDHGSGEVLVNGKLVADDDAWVRTALLVKPVGGRGPLRVAAAPAALVDIAPTLIALLNVPRAAPFDGRVLEEALAGAEGPPGVKRTRLAASP